MYCGRHNADNIQTITAGENGDPAARDTGAAIMAVRGRNRARRGKILAMEEEAIGMG